MSAEHYPDLAEDLAHLDRLLEREVLRLRARYRLSQDEFCGLYITDEHVDHLVSAERAATDNGGAEGPLLSALERRPDSRLAHFGAALGLSALELDLVLLALAPELDVKYETVFAYLNDDAGRRWPTVDLATRLLGGVGPTAVAAALAPASPLCRTGVVCVVAPPISRPAQLNAGFSLARGVVQHLLGLDALAPELVGFVERLPGESAEPAPRLSQLRTARLARLPEVLRARAAGERPVVFLVGPPGSGAEVNAMAAAAAVGYQLWSVDLDQARAHAGWAEPSATALALHVRLHRAAVLVRGNAAGERSADATLVVRRLHATGVPVFVACDADAEWHELRRSVRSVTVDIAANDFDERRLLWEAALERVGLCLPRAAVTSLAGRFALSPRQIDLALKAALDLAALSEDSLELESSISDSARRLLEQQVGRLASKVTLSATWEDLVLPKPTESRLRELAAAVKYRPLVYGEWGFGRRSGSGLGIKALFAGPSGTGKTMTAAVLAQELGLDLYRIDLSGIVSKYIGETEKNLDEIFRGARAGHALLFFDEADALFGKRSEVKDAHDRYANIEVAYLLQKLETHDGIVILATNLKGNIDDAFSRRMQYVIEFSVPDASAREALWRGMFPREVPLGPDVDWGFLARQFTLPGGDIRNVALDAAFLAAQNGQRITMKELVRATARQLVKQGRLPSPTEFQQYHSWVCDGI